MFLDCLQNVVNQQWDKVKQGVFWKHSKQHGVSRELWQRIMIEIYHYTRGYQLNTGHFAVSGF